MIFSRPITEIHRAASIVVIDGRGPETLFLGVSRKDDHTDFSFPGGKQDPNESIAACMERELFEETGYVIGSLTPSILREAFHENHTKPGVAYYCTVFKTGVKNVKKVAEPEEGGGVVKWCTAEELLKGRAFADFVARTLQMLGALPS